MAKVILPRLNQVGANEWADVQANDEAIATVVNGEISNENIAAGAAIARSKLEPGAQGIAGAWYSPKIIATEESRTNVAFGTLTTPDEITGITIGTGGLIVVLYSAQIKSSGGSTGRAAIFVGANQLKAETVTEATEPKVQEVSSKGAETFCHIASHPLGLAGPSGAAYSDTGITTGLASGLWETSGVSPTSRMGGFCIIEGLVAGTYAVSVQFKATSGSVTARNRRLCIASLG